MGFKVGSDWHRPGKVSGLISRVFSSSKKLIGFKYFSRSRIKAPHVLYFTHVARKTYPCFGQDQRDSRLWFRALSENRSTFRWIRNLFSHAHTFGKPG